MTREKNENVSIPGDKEKVLQFLPSIHHGVFNVHNHLEKAWFGGLKSPSLENATFKAGNVILRKHLHPHSQLSWLKVQSAT